MAARDRKKDVIQYAEARTAPARDAGPLAGWIRKNPVPANALGAAVIILVTLLAYIPAMRASFIWDDNYYVTENALLRNFEGLGRIWTGIIPTPSTYPLPQYYPMTFTSFWLEYQLWGLNPTGYHANNVILHMLSSLLVWLILRKLAVPGAWLAALLFAIHPVNVESVAWVSERKNVLSILFFLSSLYVYLRFAGIIAGGTKQEAPDDDGRMQWFTLPDDPKRLYWLAIILFVCALFSKTITNSMPAVVLLIIWWKRGRITLKEFKDLVPLFLVGIALGMLTAWLEKYHVGVASRPEAWDFAPTAAGELGARLIVAGRVVWFYVAKLVVPWPLAFNYPRWTATQYDPGNVLLYAIPASVLAGAVALVLLRKRLGRGPAVAVLYFLGTLVPAMGFINVWPMQYSFVADHFVYLSSIGLIALAAAIIVRYVKLELVAGVAVALMVGCFVGTWSHAKIFNNLDSLWTDTLEKTDQKSWMAGNNYGQWLMSKGNLADAELWFKHVIKIKPDHPESRFNLARIAEARARFTESRLASTTQPTTVEAGAPGSQPTTAQLADDVQRFYQQAVEWYRQAIAVQPNYVDAHYFLGVRLLAMGRADEAKPQFEQCVELFPRHELAHLALAELAMRENDTERAILHYAEAANINPNSAVAFAGWGNAFMRAGSLADGLKAWQQAMDIEPDNWRWPNDFGVKLASQGMYGESVKLFQQALRLNPEAPEALTNFGVVAARTGFPAQARELFHRALNVDPSYAKATENLQALDEGRLKPATRPATNPSSTAPTSSPTSK